MKKKLHTVRHSAARRALCSALALIMMLGLLPAGAVSAGAAGTVQYDRPDYPEVAILNYHTASKAMFLEGIKGGTSGAVASRAKYWQYNAAPLFGIEYNATIAPAKGEDTLTKQWDGFAGSAVQELAKKSQNLEVSFAATFKNNLHTHTRFRWSNLHEYETTHTAYESLMFSIDNTRIYASGGGDGIDFTNYRTGDGEFHNVYYIGNGAKIYIEDSNLYYKDWEERTCETRGASFSSTVISFRDTKAPQITGVQYSLDGGSSWVNKSKGASLGGGDRLMIKLVFDEAIRFAEDKAPDRDLYIYLIGDGKTQSENFKARLTKLSGNELYFEYTVPEYSEMGVELKIASLDLSQLVNSTLSVPLVQLYKSESESFTIPGDVKGDDGSTNGFSTSGSYITDIAGNAMVDSSISGVKITVDNQPPYVDSVTFDLALNNAEVKSALGKDTWDPESEQYKRDYIDDSDRYLGVGDSVTFYINMNEKADLTLPETAPGSRLYLLSWKKAAAVTNIWDESTQAYVTVRSRYFTPATPRLYADRTTFVMDAITMSDSMRVDGDKIMVTALEFDEDVELRDLYGNEVEKSGGRVTLAVSSSKNGNPPALDVDKPSVTGGNYTEVGNGFRYTLGISDEKTEVAGTYGSFTINNGGDGRAYDYLWAVTADAATPADGWTIGATGVAQRFEQHKTAYLHVKPKDNTTYGDLSGCTISVTAKDYAGNAGGAEFGPVDWYIDNLAPAISAGGSSCALNGDIGTLTANVVLSDSHGVSAWEYAWGDSDSSAPAAFESGGGISDTTAQSVTVQVSRDVASGSGFAEYLWVRATDSAKGKNQSAPQCLGLYSYDLRAAKYLLAYSTGLKPKAELAISELDTSDALVFAIPTGKADEYYALAVDGRSFAAGENIFDMDGWSRYKLSVSGGVYTFTKTGVTASLDSIRNGSYAGRLDVTVLSGKAGSLISGGTLIIAGDDSYKFAASSVVLRAASVTPEKNYLDPLTSYTNSYIILSSRSDLDNANTADAWDGTDESGRANTLISTFAGVTFDISISEDNYGWDCEDLDWKSSRIVISNKTNGSVTEIPIGRFTRQDDGSWGQSVTVNTGDYATGVYSVYLRLVFASDGSSCSVPFKAGVTDSAGTVYWRTLDNIVVDATAANSDFTLSSVSYGADSLWYKDAYGISEIYEDRDCTSDNGVITIPVASGCFGSASAVSSIIYGITVRSEDETDRGELEDGGKLLSYTGQYYVELWNTRFADRKVRLHASGTEQTDVTNGYGVGFTVRESEKDSEGYVYLAPDEINTVAMRKVYSNGAVSDVKQVYIRPVTAKLEGELSIDEAAGQLVFTPTDATASVGAQVHAWAYQNGEDYMSAQGERIQMNAAPDGTWRCALAENGAMYRVLTISAEGSVWEGGSASARAPWFADGVKYDSAADGTYTLSFELRDDQGSMDEGLRVDVGFNEEYCGRTFSFRTDRLEKSDGYSEYYRSYEWRENNVSDTGIYGISAVRGSHDGYDYIRITLSGVVVRPADGAEGAARAMQAFVTATDDCGYSNTESSGEETVAYRQPEIYTSGANAPELSDDGLVLRFSQPVRPEESWAWRESDGDGFETSWTGAFPVTGNGTYELRYRDVFGNVCSQKITTDAFMVNGTDWSVDVTLSGEELTREAVYATGSMRQKSSRAGLLIWDADSGSVIVPEGLYDGNYYRDNPYREFDPTRPWTEGSKYATSSPRTVKLENNAALYVSCYDTQYVVDHSRLVFRQKVYVDNIANSAPAADVRYYVNALAREFTQDTLEQYIADNGGSVTLEGSVRVWYRTSRHVTPLDGSGSEFTFEPGGAAEHTFSYQDDMGNTASVTVSLPNGLSLVKPAVEPEDNEAPQVNVDVYARRSGTYTRGANFVPAYDDAADIADRFENLGYAQGYSLAVNAYDPSGVDIAVSEAEGVVLTGNIITVVKPADFTVTVADRSANSAANRISFTVTREMLKNLDTTAPTAKITSEATSMYSKNIYVKLTDLTDAGADTGSARLLEPAGLTVVPTDGSASGKDVGHEGEYKLEVLDNSGLHFVFADYAGNRGEADFGVTGIDSTPPELTVTWSPGTRVEDEDGVRYYPPSDASPVNTDVAAIIDSDRAIYGLELNILGQSVKLLERGARAAAEPYEIKEGETVIARIYFAPERIKVIYAENCPYRLKFTASAASGRYSTAALEGFSGIDKVKPNVNISLEPNYRRAADGSAYSAPYSVKATLTPDERATSQNYGRMESYTDYDGSIVRVPVMYDGYEPLEITFTANGTYNVYFADAAGNTTIVPVTIEDIDREAPVITLSDRTESGNEVTVKVSVNEACTLAWSGGSHVFASAGEHSLTFTDNGAYTITAVDAAGNESSRTVTVGSIDKITPSISFESNTLYVLAGTGAEELEAALDAGYTAWDNVTADGYPLVSHDASGVKLAEEGLYTVVYTVTDKAGNVRKANRFVRVIGSDTVCVRIDGKVILPGGTAVIRPGEHTFELENSAEVFAIKARSGILSEGQMKYMSGSSISFAADGKFSVSAGGYYTLLVTTQSRQTVRILLYVER